jgi:hypothetical protein
MQHRLFQRVGFGAKLAYCVAFACLYCLSPGIALAEDIVSIEEQWELSVGGPIPERSAPQVTMTMCPTDNLECHYFVFALNHWSHPDFAPGGVQLQHWHGDEIVSSHPGPADVPLDTEDETVSWTQRIAIEDGTITFEVVDGTSESWGDFGGSGYLKKSLSTSLSNLNGYRPAISLNESGISYAGNRVSSLVLKRLVWVTANGEQHELVAPIDVDTDLDP